MTTPPPSAGPLSSEATGTDKKDLSQLGLAMPLQKEDSPRKTKDSPDQHVDKFLKEASQILDARAFELQQRLEYELPNTPPGDLSNKLRELIHGCVADATADMSTRAEQLRECITLPQQKHHCNAQIPRQLKHPAGGSGPAEWETVSEEEAEAARLRYYLQVHMLQGGRFRLHMNGLPEENTGRVLFRSLKKRDRKSVV